MPENLWVLYGALPAAVAFASVGLIRLISGQALGGRIASTGAGIALLVAYALMRDPLPLLEDRTALLLVALVAVGLVSDLLFANVRLISQTIAIVSPLLAFMWLRCTTLEGATSLYVAVFGVCFVAIAVISFNFSSFEPSSTRPAIMLAMAALGVGLVMLFDGARLSAGISLSAAAAVGGFFLWNWPKQRFAGGNGLLVGVAAALLSLSAAAALAGTSRLGLALLVLVFFADKIFRLPAFDGSVGRALEPILLAGVCGLIVLAAVAASTLTHL